MLRTKKRRNKNTKQKPTTIVIGFVLAPPVGLEPTTPSLAVPDEKLP